MKTNMNPELLTTFMTPEQVLNNISEGLVDNSL